MTYDEKFRLGYLLAAIFVPFLMAWGSVALYELISKRKVEKKAKKIILIAIFFYFAWFIGRLKNAGMID